MKKLICTTFILSLLFGLIFPSFAEEEKTYTTYQLEYRDVSLKEVQDVINRTVGSGTVDVARGKFLRKGIQSQGINWTSTHSGAKVVGGVPFYGPRNLVVAYEYYLQCGDTICGSIYDVFPGKTSMDEVMDLFVKGKKCLEKYECYFPQDYYAVYTKSGKIGHFGVATEEEFKDMYLIGPIIQPTLVPDIVPTSIRLAESIPEGKMKFFHGIYAIRGKDLKVISLDPRDTDITVSELKKRLVGLVDFSMQSPTIPLMFERAKLNGQPYSCTQINTTPRDIYISNGDGVTFTKEKEIPIIPNGMYYRPLCLGMQAWVPLFLGSYSIASYPYVDIFSGRIGSFCAPDETPYLTYLDIPLK